MSKCRMYWHIIARRRRGAHGLLTFLSICPLVTNQFWSAIARRVPLSPSWPPNCPCGASLSSTVTSLRGKAPPSRSALPCSISSEASPTPTACCRSGRGGLRVTRNACLLSAWTFWGATLQPSQHSKAGCQECISIGSTTSSTSPVGIISPQVSSRRQGSMIMQQRKRNDADGPSCTCTAHIWIQRFVRKKPRTLF
jgi:hypothetical protein